MLFRLIRIIAMTYLLSFGNSILASTCSELNGNFGHQALGQNVLMSTQSYRTAQDYLGQTVKLQADVYQASLNWNIAQLKQRPLLVLYHGGGFKAEGRNSGLLKAFATYFAQRGYVVVSAEYRIGWENSDATALCGGGTQKDYLDAQYRAMQDERALVQYFKSQSNTVLFDTSRIFLLGISSGATLVCARLQDEWISSNERRAERLGPLEVFEGNRDFSTEVAGILSFSGANVSPIISSDYQTPIAFFHGTCDNAVPYEEQYLASCINMGYYYGPKVLSKSLEEQGVCYQTYTYCGYGHDFASVGDEQRVFPWALKDILEKSIDFMQSVMCRQCVSKEELTNEQVDVQPVADCSRIVYADICGDVLLPEKQTMQLTPNLFHDNFIAYLHSNFEREEKVWLNIYDMSGRLMQSTSLQISEGTHIQKIELLPMIKGVYIYQVINDKKVFSSGKIWKI